MGTIPTIANIHFYRPFQIMLRILDYLSSEIYTLNRKENLVNYPLFSHWEHTRLGVRWKFPLKILSFQNMNKEDACGWVHIPIRVHL